MRNFDGESEDLVPFIDRPPSEMLKDHVGFTATDEPEPDRDAL